MDKIIEYIMHTTNNFNESVFRSIVGDELSEEEILFLIDYCKTTHWNTNRAILYSLLGSSADVTNSLQNEDGIDLMTEDGVIIEAGV